MIRAGELGPLNDLDQRSRLQTPSPDEGREVWEKVRRGVNDDQRSKVPRTRPNDAKEHAAHGQGDDGVSNGVEWRGISSQALDGSSVTEDESRRVRQTKEQGHQDDARDF